MSDRARTVYSTEKRATCPTCGWPEHDCHCSARAGQAVPERVTALLRLEKKGRGGKSVTVVDGLPRNGAFLKGLAAELKRARGTGGTVAAGTVEVQGDQRDGLRAMLRAKGWTVKG